MAIFHSIKLAILTTLELRECRVECRMNQIENIPAASIKSERDL